MRKREKKTLERNKVSERWIRWCDVRGLVASSETSSIAPHLNIYCTLVHVLQQCSHPNPPQPINKHLTGTEIQYRELH